MRLIIDTNVLVSAIIFKGSIKDSLTALIRSPQFDFLLSDAVRLEVEQTLFREKFLSKIGKPDLQREVQAFFHLCEMIPITQQVKVCRDPEDDKFLELALCGRADCIITGDQDLLTLHPFEGIEILSLADFVAKYLRD